MPPAVAAAGIGAGASVLGGVLGMKGAKSASNASLQAQREALAYEREKEAARKAEYDQAVKRHEAQTAAWEANRRGLLGRYGLPMGAPMRNVGLPPQSLAPPMAAAPPGVSHGRSPVDFRRLGMPPGLGPVQEDPFEWGNF